MRMPGRRSSQSPLTFGRKTSKGEQSIRVLLTLQRKAFRTGVVSQP